VNLRSCETDAFVRVHRLDHVVDQFAELARLDVLDFDIRRFLAQNRMSKTRDLKNRHQFLPNVEVITNATRVSAAAPQNAPRTPAKS